MSGNRPLDDRERKRFTYFSSLSPMARKIMQDKEKIREKYGPEWARLPPAQQDEIIDRCLVGPRAPAAAADAGDVPDPERFPGLRGPTGQKLVRFGDEVGAAGRPTQGRVGCEGEFMNLQTVVLRAYVIWWAGFLSPSRTTRCSEGLRCAFSAWFLPLS